ncbi:MAG TPA: c-type cytochrome [Burkholderiales bacterium]|nr:c-type cytochrome [Burkholderiales bacterium]
MTRSGFLAFALAVGLVPLTLPGVASAAKSDSCAHCHGTDGNSSSSAYPNLAGQTPQYLVKQITDFKEGRRKNPMMSPAVGVLSAQEIQELADYFSSQILSRSTFQTEPAIVAQGKQLAEQAKCVACHQAGYKGLKEFPRLARQKYPYLVKQLKDFRDGARTNDNGAMAASVKDLTDEQIQALAQYLTSL